MENLELLVKELVKQPTETECIEFKHNNFDPETAPKYMKYIPFCA